jgi:hypothetical protein
MHNEFVKERVLFKGIYPLNRNAFKDIEFLTAKLRETPGPADIETVHFEDGVIDIRTPSTNGVQQTEEVLKKISSLRRNLKEKYSKTKKHKDKQTASKQM